MLDGFRAGGEPPFLLSDACPDDLMPFPAHAVAAEGRRKSKGALYLKASAFQAVAAGALSVAPDDAVENPIQASTRVQTAIDRDLGSAADGQLFETDTQHLGNSVAALSLYVRSDRHLGEVLACLTATAWTGFGKKSSSGLGAFELVGAPEACEWMDSRPGANAWMSLSHFVPAADDPTDGRWGTHVTFPKFHGNAVANVFKGAVVMLTPGSVFRVDGDLRAWYGSMIRMPRPEMPGSVHYAMGFPVPMIWADQR
jgi:CRISPR-associated protein Csm4